VAMEPDILLSAEQQRSSSIAMCFVEMRREGQRENSRKGR
jgi:hypothetical protein